MSFLKISQLIYLFVNPLKSYLVWNNPVPEMNIESLPYNESNIVWSIIFGI